jgi:glycosyltransferase involved in cell wall biosynthesis
MGGYKKMSKLKTDPVVSVIIPCYNEGKHITETVNSIKDSTYKNIEIIIVDDGSTDHVTNTILNNFEGNSLTVVRIKNSGVCVARDTGILRASGKYILPVDADDLISKDYISLCVTILEKNETIKVVTCDYKFFGKKSNVIITEPYTIEKLMGRNLFIITSMFRRKDYSGKVAFNPLFRKGLEDWDFWLSLLEDGGNVAKVDGIHFFYRIKKRNKSRNALVSDTDRRHYRELIWNQHALLYKNIYCDPTESGEYRMLKNSLEFKLGNLLLRPIRMILEKIPCIIF